MKTSSEILLNATEVTAAESAGTFEFIFDERLLVTECVQITSMMAGVVAPVPRFASKLSGQLFELNHVRVNPEFDNAHIIKVLTEVLTEIGLNIFNQPDHHSMAICYKPLGEISGNVRFVIDQQGHATFLSPDASKLRLVYSNPNFEPPPPSH